MLAAAKGGDFRTYSTLQRRAYGLRRPDVLKKTLALAPFHLQPPLPKHPTRSDECSQVPFESEILATTALGVITEGFDYTAYHAKPDDKQLALLRYAIFRTRLNDLLRWMTHLFSSWAFEFQDGTVQDQYGKTIRDTIILNVRVLLQHLVQFLDGYHILDQMGDEEDTGTLLAQCTIVAARDNVPPLLKIATSTRRVLEQRVPEKRWAKDFIRSLESHPLAFGQAIISRIQRCSEDTFSSESHYVVVNLCECIRDSKTVLLDACLEQPRVISSFVAIFRNLIQGLEPDSVKPESPPPNKEQAFQDLAMTAGILLESFNRGGQAFVAVALRQSLLACFISLLVTITDEGVDPDVSEYLDQSTATLVGTMTPFVFYPSVFCFALGFVNNTIGEAVRDRKTSFTRLRDAIQKFLSAAQYELNIVYGNSQGKRRSDYLPVINMTRFCDNDQCPHPEKVLSRLGQCSACSTGFYCSRSCQKIVWKATHRQECKDTVESRRDGKEGFPPVLTTHELTYLQNTLLARFRCWRDAVEAQQGIKLPLTERSRFCMDFTVYPTDVHYSGHTNEEFLDAPGPTVRGRFAVATGLGKKGHVVWIEKFGIPLELLE